MDSCVECGYCESSCPSAGLTLTPRERIVAFRQLESMDPGSKLAVMLRKELDYQADASCATDGMCAVNCPVGINTGTFVKELRAAKAGGLMQTAGVLAQRYWGSITKIARVGLKTASRFPALAESLSSAIAKLFPKGTFPQWSRSISSQGFSRLALVGGSGDFVYLPSCMNEMFGDPAIARILEISRSNGLAIEVPNKSTSFCCGTPFSSKGLTTAFANQKQKNQELLSSLGGKTVIIDGSSCHQTMLEQQSHDLLELSEFVARHLMHVPVKKRHAIIVLHPTCSGEGSGVNQAMREIAERISDQVVVPQDWKCCGFAGDRGMLLPELTRHATSQEAQEVSGEQALFVSNNQPCQLAMTGATGKKYTSILEAWLQSV